MANTNRNDEFRAKYSKAVARAWVDDAYKAKLLGDPRAALSDVGIEFPVGKNVTVAEDDGESIRLVLPSKPEGEIKDESVLQSVAAGFSASAISGFC